MLNDEQKIHLPVVSHVPISLVVSVVLQILLILEENGTGYLVLVGGYELHNLIYIQIICIKCPCTADVSD